MFQLFKQQAHIDVNNPNSSTDSSSQETHPRFRSHSFSISAALALICCQPCKMETVDGKKMCLI